MMGAEEPRRLKTRAWSELSDSHRYLALNSEHFMEIWSILFVMFQQYLIYCLLHYDMFTFELCQLCLSRPQSLPSNPPRAISIAPPV